MKVTMLIQVVRDDSSLQPDKQRLAVLRFCVLVSVSNSVAWKNGSYPLLTLYTFLDHENGRLHGQISRSARNDWPGWRRYYSFLTFMHFLDPAFIFLFSLLFIIGQAKPPSFIIWNWEKPWRRFLLSDLMSKHWIIKNISSRFGMLVGRTRSGRCGRY